MRGFARKCTFEQLTSTLNYILSIRSSEMGEFPSLQSDIGLRFTRTSGPGSRIFSHTLQEISVKRTTAATPGFAAKMEQLAAQARRCQHPVAAFLLSAFRQDTRQPAPDRREPRIPIPLPKASPPPQSAQTGETRARLRYTTLSRWNPTTTDAAGRIFNFAIVSFYHRVFPKLVRYSGESRNLEGCWIQNVLDSGFRRNNSSG